LDYGIVGSVKTEEIEALYKEAEQGDPLAMKVIDRARASVGWLRVGVFGVVALVALWFLHPVLGSVLSGLWLVGGLLAASIGFAGWVCSLDDMKWAGKIRATSKFYGWDRGRPGIGGLGPKEAARLAKFREARAQGKWPTSYD
jgi:hypothetical protein